MRRFRALRAIPFLVALLALLASPARAEGILALTVGGGTAIDGVRHERSQTGAPSADRHMLGLHYLESSLLFTDVENEAYFGFAVTMDYVSRGRVGWGDDPATVTDAEGSSFGLRAGFRRSRVHAGGGVGLGVMRSQHYAGETFRPETLDTVRYNYLSGNLTLGLALINLPEAVLELQARYDMRLFVRATDSREGFDQLVAVPTAALAFSWAPDRWVPYRSARGGDDAWGRPCPSRCLSPAGRGAVTGWRALDAVGKGFRILSRFR